MDETTDKAILKFLKDRLQQYNGSIPLQSLSGHLNQLDKELKVHIASRSDLLKFLKSHKDVFYINFKNDLVKLITVSKVPTDSVKNGIGIILKLFPTYGIIKATEPFETSVYFNAAEFEGLGSTGLLVDCDLHVGSTIHFNAVKGHENLSAKYRATKVWQFMTNQKKTHMFDPNYLEGEGTIHNVFQEFGFITYDKTRSIFFHKNHLKNYANVTDLTQIINIGDLVEFSAIRSTKKDTTARFEAVKVHLKKKVSHMPKKQPNEKIIEAYDANDSLSNYSCSVLSSSSHGKSRLELCDERGKIYPRKSGTVIKFGKNLSQLADADSSKFYLYGTEVKEILWEFSEGDDVSFDAVQIKSVPGWKALLVWIGDKPNVVLSASLGDWDCRDTDVDDDDDIEINSYSSTSGISLADSHISRSSNFKHRRRKSVDSINSHDSYKSKTSRGNYKSSKSHGKNASEHCSISSKPLPSKNFKSKQKQRSVGNVNENLSSLKPLKVYKDWADSPDPEEVVETADDRLSDIVQNDETLFINVKNTASESEEYYSEQEVDNLNSKEEIDEYIDKTKMKASIKTYENVTGKISKVYCKFAEIKNNKFSKLPVLTFCDLYRNGVSVAEHFDDLQEFLKEEDTIFFDFFEIVDDEGELHQKLTMAWTGQKPKVNTISTKKFISDFKLKVTISEESTFKNEETSVLCPKKFLPVISNTNESDSVDDTSIAEIPKSSLKEVTQHVVPVPTISKMGETEEPVLEYKLLSRVSEILERKGISLRESEIDFDSLVEDIVCAISKHAQPVICSSNVYSINNADMKNETHEEIDRTEFSHQYKKICDTEVQTIITGEVIAQSIFTQC